MFIRCFSAYFISSSYWLGCRAVKLKWTKRETVIEGRNNAVERAGGVLGRCKGARGKAGKHKGNGKGKDGKSMKKGKPKNK